MIKKNKTSSNNKEKSVKLNGCVHSWQCCDLSSKISCDVVLCAYEHMYTLWCDGRDEARRVKRESVLDRPNKGNPFIITRTHSTIAPSLSQPRYSACLTSFTILNRKSWGATRHSTYYHFSLDLEWMIDTFIDFYFSIMSLLNDQTDYVYKHNILARNIFSHLLKRMTWK